MARLTPERIRRVRDAFVAERDRRRRAAALKRVLDEIEALADEHGVDFCRDVNRAMLVEMSKRAH